MSTNKCKIIGDGVNACDPSIDAPTTKRSTTTTATTVSIFNQEIYNGGSQFVDNMDSFIDDYDGYPSYNSFTKQSYNSFTESSHNSITDSPVFSTRETQSWLRPLLTTVSAVQDGQYICRREADCHENANCEYEQESRKYKCKCKKWYEGDGWSTCNPGK